MYILLLVVNVKMVILFVHWFFMRFTNHSKSNFDYSLHAVIGDYLLIE